MLYRLLTGEDSSAFCHKITQALEAGWELYGGPSYAFDQVSGGMRCAQAVIKREHGTYDPDRRLGEQ